MILIPIGKPMVKSGPNFDHVIITLTCLVRGRAISPQYETNLNRSTSHLSRYFLPWTCTGLPRAPTGTKEQPSTITTNLKILHIPHKIDQTPKIPLDASDTARGEVDFGLVHEDILLEGLGRLPVRSHLDWLVHGASARFSRFEWSSWEADVKKNALLTFNKCQIVGAWQLLSFEVFLPSPKGLQFSSDAQRHHAGRPGRWSEPFGQISTLGECVDPLETRNSWESSLFLITLEGLSTIDAGISCSYSVGVRCWLRYLFGHLATLMGLEFLTDLTVTGMTEFCVHICP